MNEIKVDLRIKLLDWLLSFSKPIERMTLEELRRLPEIDLNPLFARLILGKSRELPLVASETISGRHGDIPLRLYYPTVQTSLPLLIFMHGGGWVSGNFDTHDAMCRRIAHDTGCLAIAIKYRLAPWHKYPTALEDCYDAIARAVQNAPRLGADASSIFVMGDSAGGNLAAAVCLMARDLSEFTIKRQILLYPVMDGSMRQPSMDRYAHAPLLTKERMHCFINYYTRREGDRKEPYFSPLLAPDLSNLPPALVITAQYDPLHDEGQAYAQRLREAAIAVQASDYPGMVHSFISFPRFCRGAEPALKEIIAYIKQAIEEPTPVTPRLADA